MNQVNIVYLHAKCWRSWVQMNALSEVAGFSHGEIKNIHRNKWCSQSEWVMQLHWIVLAPSLSPPFPLSLYFSPMPPPPPPSRVISLSRCLSISLSLIPVVIYKCIWTIGYVKLVQITKIVKFYQNERQRAHIRRIKINIHVYIYI